MQDIEDLVRKQESVPIFIIGSKSNLERVVTMEDVMKFLYEVKRENMEVSSLKGKHVAKVLTTAIKEMKKSKATPKKSEEDSGMKKENTEEGEEMVQFLER
jgi:hypothetical protein